MNQYTPLSFGRLTRLQVALTIALGLLILATGFLLLRAYLNTLTTAQTFQTGYVIADLVDIERRILTLRIETERALGTTPPNFEQTTLQRALLVSQLRTAEPETKDNSDIDNSFVLIQETLSEYDRLLTTVQETPTSAQIAETKPGFDEIFSRLQTQIQLFNINEQNRFLQELEVSQNTQQNFETLLLGTSSMLLLFGGLLAYSLRRTVSGEFERAFRLLETEVVERKKIGEELQQERNLLRVLIDNLPDIIYVKDTQSRYLIANETVARLFDVDQSDELIGRTNSDFFPSEMAQQFYADEQELIKSGQPLINHEEFNIDSAGAKHWLLTTKIPFHNSQGQIAGLVGLSRDITERKQSEVAVQQAHDELARRVSDLAVLNHIAQTVATMTDLESALTAFTHEIVEIFGACSSSIALRNAEGTELHIVADYARNEAVPSAVGTIIPIAGNPSSTKLVEDKQPLIIPDAQNNPLTKPIHDLMSTLELQCLMLIPLTIRGKVIGSFSVDTDQVDREFSPDELQLAGTIGGQIAGTIDNIRLFEEEQQQRQMAESLRQVTTILSSSLDQEAVLTKIMEQLRAVIEYNSASLFLEDGDELLLATGVGLNNDEIGFRTSITSDHLAAKLFRKRQALLISDVHNHPDWNPVLSDPRIRGWMAAPLFTSQQTVGLLCVDSFSIKSYNQQDMQVLQTFANQSTIAIRNAQLYQDVQREKQLFETMLQSSPVAIVTINLDQDVVSWNPAAEKLFGYSKAEVLGRNIDDIVTSAETRAEAVGFSEKMVKGEQIHAITQRNRKDGSLVNVEFLAVPVILDEEPVLVFALYHDLTEIKQAEEALQQKNEDLAHTLTELQATQQELIQSEKMAALGQLIAGVAHEVNTPLGAIRASIDNISEALGHTISELPQVFSRLSPAQQTDFFALSKTAVQSRERLTSREKRQLKREVKQALTTASIENATPLANLLVNMGLNQEIDPFLPLFQTPNNLEIVRTAYHLAVQQRNSENIKLAVDRASKVVFALKSYARYDASGEKIKAQISEGIDVVLTLYHNHLKQGIEVETVYEPVPPILCYPDELNQVWTNLLHNAIQAMEGQGRLAIEVRKMEDRGVEIEDREEKQSPIVNRQSPLTDYLTVSITDNGPGIPEDVKARIFEPFFTTKKAGEGSGLGLDIVRKIVEKHDGKIEAESEPGRTTFRVWLPFEEMTAG